MTALQWNRTFRTAVPAGALAVAAIVSLAGPVPATTTAAGVDPATVSVTLEAGAASTFTSTVTTPHVPPRPDIVFLADTTGSMQPALANVGQNARRLIAEIQAVQPDARFAVTSYKEQASARAFHVETPLTAETEMVMSGVQDWMYNVGGGGAPWTDFINAHYRLGTDAVAYRPSGTRIIAWFGDARSHDPSMGHTLDAATAALRSERVRVVAVPVQGSTDGLDALGQASSITQATDGVLMPAQPGNQVAQALLDGIRALSVTVAPTATCDPAVTVRFDAPTRTVRSGTTATFATTVEARPGAAAGTYRCTVDYLVGGLSADFGQQLTVTVGPDTVPPTITATVTPAAPDGANGWYVSAPTVSFRCADPSGIASCSGPTTLGSSAQPQTVTGTAVDTRGNRASATSPGLKVDLVDPVLTCGPTPTFAAGSAGQVTATVNDAHSGPATATATATADTTTTGDRTARITGTDRAGRHGSVDCPYVVQRVPAKLVAQPAALGIRPVLQFTLTPRATLTRADTGTPLAGRAVAFTAGNRPVCTAVTSTTGVATCTGPVDLVSVLLTGYTATFAGSDTISPATARGRLG